MLCCGGVQPLRRSSALQAQQTVPRLLIRMLRCCGFRLQHCKMASVDCPLGHK